jgi:hypothetical protein
VLVWNTASLGRLPVVLLSPPLVELVRTAAARGKLIGGIENHVLFYADFSSYLSRWVDRGGLSGAGYRPRAETGKSRGAARARAAGRGRTDAVLPQIVRRT